MRSRGMTNTQFLQTAEEAARAAAKVLEHWAGEFTVSEKRPADLVTEADHESQRVIHEIIAGRFPDHGFLGEEGLRETGHQSPYRWIVDPLDGTSNYVHRFPYYGVSIALERDGQLILGVVLDPNRNELFTAVRGEGAFLNGQPIHPSRRNRLEEALVLVSLPVNVSREHRAVKQFLRVLERAQHVQRTGSAALNLCYVACGRVDAFFSLSLKPWDVAAGAIIIEAAGGRVSTTGHERLDISISDLLATNGTPLHSELSALLQSAAAE